MLLPSLSYGGRESVSLETGLLADLLTVLLGPEDVSVGSLLGLLVLRLVVLDLLGTGLGLGLLVLGEGVDTILVSLGHLLVGLLFLFRETLPDLGDFGGELLTLEAGLLGDLLTVHPAEVDVGVGGTLRLLSRRASGGGSLLVDLPPTGNLLGEFGTLETGVLTDGLTVLLGPEDVGVGGPLGLLLLFVIGGGLGLTLLGGGGGGHVLVDSHADDTGDGLLKVPGGLLDGVVEGLHKGPRGELLSEEVGEVGGELDADGLEKGVELLRDGLEDEVGDGVGNGGGRHCGGGVCVLWVITESGPISQYSILGNVRNFSKSGDGRYTDIVRYPHKPSQTHGDISIVN